MISISRNFRLLIIDDNESDLKVIQRLISKDFKSIDVTARNGITDWKIFLEGNKFDLILLNYAAGSSLGLQELKKIIAVNDTIPVYIMIWQHEVEVGLKAVYQGAEGFVIKDKTYLNLKKVIQRFLVNYLISSELNSLRDINDLISEEVNDGFFRFSKEGELEYLSDKFIKLLGFEAEFELNQICKNLFQELKEHVKKTDDYDKQEHFIFQVKGKDNFDYWFDVYFYKKIDLRNDVIYYEGILKNITETKIQESTIKKLKDEVDLLFNQLPLPIEVYDKEWKQLYTNTFFTKLVSSINPKGKEFLSQAKEFVNIKETISKLSDQKISLINNQKVTFNGKEKYFDLFFIRSENNPNTFFIAYKDITDSIKLQKLITESSIRRIALYNSADIGFIELSSDLKIIDISDKALLMLGKAIKNYIKIDVSEIFDKDDYGLLKNAIEECHRFGRSTFFIKGNIKITLSIIGNSISEIFGYIISLENISTLKETEQALKENIERISIFQNTDKLFLWHGYITGNNFKPIFVSKGIENILGVTVEEALDIDSKISEELFGGCSAKDFIKYAKDNSEKEINLRNSNGIPKRIRIKYDLQKETKDYYKLCALFEDITSFAESIDNIKGISDFINKQFSNENVLLVRLDEFLVVNNIYHSNLSDFDKIDIGDAFFELATVKDFDIVELLNKSLKDNSFIDTIISSDKNRKKKIHILVIPSIAFSGKKFLYVYLKDITDKYEETKKYDFLKKTIDSFKYIEDIFILTLEENKITFANDGFYNLTGYKRQEVIDKKIETFITKDSYDEFTKAIKNLKNKNSGKLKIKVIDKFSNIKYCNINFSCVSRDEEGDVLFLFGFDETKQNEYKKDLYYEKDLKNIISLSSRDALIIWKNNSIIYCNNSVFTLYGYKYEELETLHPADLFSPVQEKEILDNINSIINGKTEIDTKGLQLEVICKRKHGQEFPAEILINRYLLNSDTVVCLHVKDITEKKNLQKALFNIDNRLRGVIESLNEGIWLFDNDYKTIFISPNIQNQLNYSIEEILERRIFYFIKDSGFDFDKKYFEETEDARYSNLNLTFIKKDNDLFHSLTNMIPLKDNNGKFIGGILAITDISELIKRDNEIQNLKDKNINYNKKIKLLEQDLSNSKKLIIDYKSEVENLFLEIENINNSTKSIRDELNKKNNYIRNLNFFVQNYLKNPITNLVGFVNFLESIWSKIDIEQQERYLKILYSNVSECRNTFERISIFNKIESSELKIKPQIINLTELIAKKSEFYEEKFLAKSQVLDYKIENNKFSTLDVYLLELVFDEIFKNIIDVSEKNSKIDVKFFESNDSFRITFDSSIIDKNKISLLINNQDLSNISVNNNFDLSVFVIKGIIEKHKGKLAFLLSENNNFSVIVDLPKNDNQMIICTDEENYIILANYFDNRNHEIQLIDCNNSSDLLEKVNNNKLPLAIFVSFIEPEIKFFEFLDLLQNKVKYNQIPIIVMTSDNSIELKKKLLDRNIIYILNLPLSKENINNLFDQLEYRTK